MLDKLVRPTSISGDAQVMHKTILAIVAAPLAKSLEELNRRFPGGKVVTQLLESLRPHLNSQRSTKCSMAEAREWSLTPNGGLRRTVGNLVGRLTSWSAQSELNPVPPNYTHRLFVHAVQLLGADEALTVVLDEIEAQTNLGFGSAALEVGSASLCAPTAHLSGSGFQNGATRASSSQLDGVRKALSARMNDSKYLLDQKVAKTETLVRLGRLVNVHSAVSQGPNLSLGLTNIGTDELMQGIDLTAADLAVTSEVIQQSTDLSNNSSVDFTSGLDTVMDLSGPTAVNAQLLDDSNGMQLDLSSDLFGADQDMDFSLGQPPPQGQQQQSTDMLNLQNNAVAAQLPNDDDIFAGLDFGGMGGEDDFNF